MGERRGKNVGVQTNGWSGRRLFVLEPRPSAPPRFFRGRQTPPVHTASAQCTGLTLTSSTILDRLFLQLKEMPGT